jgi:DNA-binding NtrC family response regulator
MNDKKRSELNEEDGDGLQSVSPLSEITAEAEREYIIKVLRSTHGNRTKAAGILGISRKTLWEKVKALHIDSEQFEE